MQDLVSRQGCVKYGLFEEPVYSISFQDYDYRTPMGYRLPRALRKFKAKRFQFFGICGPKLMLGMAVVDLGYLCSAFMYVYDKRTGKMRQGQGTTPNRNRAAVEPSPEFPRSWLQGRELSLEMKGERIWARSREAELHASLRAAHHSPIRLCTRAGYTGWSYTQKTMPIHLSAELLLGGQRVTLESPEHMGVMDWSGGYMRRHTFWNWASSSCRLPDGRDMGLNLSCGTNETSFTENAFWIDGNREKVDTVHFQYQARKPLLPWRIVSCDGKVDLLFYPEKSKEEKRNALVLATRFTQLMGSFQGVLITGKGERIEVKDCWGWTEDHYAKW